jgi:hypothetical protein
METETNAVIENIIEAVYGKHSGARERHIFREALLGLVRLAKSEQLRDIKFNADRLVRLSVSTPLSQHGESDSSQNYLPPSQQQIEFPRFT